MGSGSLLKVLAKNFDVLAGPLVALAYPLYASVKAIETKSSVDDQQWLTYWVLYSLITLFELTFASIIEWLPFWSSMKLIFISWLVLPYFSGAAYVYQNYVRPVYVRNHMVNIWYVPQKKGLFGKSDDFLTALDKYIEENGPEALKKLADKAGKSSKQSGNVERVERIKITEGVDKSKGIKRYKSLEGVEGLKRAEEGTEVLPRIEKGTERFKRTKAVTGRLERAEEITERSKRAGGERFK